VLLDGETVEDASVPVGPKATLWRGGGWFETLAVWDGAPYNLKPHLQRLRGSLPPTLEQSLPDDLGQRLRGLAADVPGPARMKIVAWEEGETPRHAAWVRPYDPPAPETYRRGVELAIERRSHPPRWPQSHQKRTAYAPVMASRREVEAWDVLYCDLEGRPWETGVANVFWMRGDDVLFTPPAGSRLLPGTLLEALIDRAAALGMTVRESSQPWTRLEERVGVCNSLVGMLPVRRVGGRDFPVDPRSSPWRELQRELLSDRVVPDWHGEAP